MLPIPLDVLIAVFFYLVLMLMYVVLQKTDSHSLMFRILCILFSYLFVAAIVDYAANIVLICVDLFQGRDPFLALAVFFILLMTGYFINWYVKPHEKLDTVEMENFIKASLLLTNYIRRTDADTRAAIDSHRVRTIYAETRGTEPSPDITAASYDQHVTKFKKFSPDDLRSKGAYVPPGYRDDISILDQKVKADVSQSFRFELVKRNDLPLFDLMDHFYIDPKSLRLTFDIIFPHEQQHRLRTEPEKIKHVQQIYEGLLMVISENWFDLYARFIRDIEVFSFQLEFDGSMKEVRRPLMSFSVSLEDLRKRLDVIVSGHTILSFATVHFL